MPFDVNHLCPLITHSSPLRIASWTSESGRAALSGSVIEKRSAACRRAGMEPLLFLASVPK